jgi:hypothetical protein
MKKVLVIWALFIFSVSFSSALGGVMPYDSTAFICWASAYNDSGESAIAFVKKTDTVGNAIPPIAYQLYKNGQLISSNVILLHWNIENVVMNLYPIKFAVALDKDGWAHFACNGDSGSCLYLTNRDDGVWKTRQILKQANCGVPAGQGPYGQAFFGRSNAIAVNNSRVAIATSCDYTTYGAWPFSCIWYLSVTLNGDSLIVKKVNTGIGHDYEELRNILISNRFNRLTIFYWQSESGGFEGVNVLSSRDYPAADTFNYLRLIDDWNFSYELEMVSESQTEITLGIAYSGPSSGAFTPFQNYYVFISPDSLTESLPVKIVSAPRQLAAAKNRLSEKVFDPLGRSFANQSGARVPAGIYFFKNAEGTSKRLFTNQ